MYKQKYQKYLQKVNSMKGGFLDESGKNTICDICQENKIKLLFGSCGHCACISCYDNGRITKCHLCRSPITKVVFIPPQYSDKDADWFLEKEENDILKRYKFISNIGSEYELHTAEQESQEIDNLTQDAIRDAQGHLNVQITRRQNNTLRLEIENLRNNAIREREQVSRNFKGFIGDIDYWCGLISNYIKKEKEQSDVSFSERILYCKERLQKTIDNVVRTLNEFDTIRDRFIQNATNRGFVLNVDYLPLSERDPSTPYTKDDVVRTLEKGRLCLNMN